MGRQWNQIIESLGPLTGGSMSINANLTDIEALLTTLQADIVDGIIVSSGSSVITGGTLGQLTGGTVNVTNTTRTISAGTVNATPTRGTTTTGTLTAGTTNGTLFSSSTSRNYLLVQCTSGTAFIDTNGTATTTDGIQLTSGQGITFEGSFIPTGAIAAITSTGTARVIGIQG